MRAGARVRQSESGRDRDVAGSELRHNRRGPSPAQLNGQAYIALNEKCETVKPSKSVGVVCSRRKAIKIPKSSMCSVPWNMTYGTAKTQLADVLFTPKTVYFFLEAWIPHKGGLWEYDTSMEVSSHNPQEAFSPSCLLLVGCHHIHSPFPDRCL